MSTQTRKERERAQRQQRIIDTARELAEAEGWDAVTVRRLADRIEYSQPVLYSHFAGKSAIVGAVAVQGCVELTAVLRAARDAAGADRARRFAGLATTYLDFAAAHPATYDAIFSLDTDLIFGLGALEPLREAFAEIEAVFAGSVADADLPAYTELCWSALHGLADLDRSGRLRPELRADRLRLLIDQWTAVAARTGS